MVLYLPPVVAFLNDLIILFAPPGSLATLFIWLVIASGAAVAQAAWNRDELYQVGPFAEPAPALLKKKCDKFA